MNRRFFLKLIGVVAGSAIFGEDLLGLADLNAVGVGKRVRVTCALDIYHDCYFYRYDILTKDGTQLMVTASGDSVDGYKDPWIRDAALGMLKREMKHRRIRYRDLVDAPMPGIEGLKVSRIPL